MNRHEDPPPIFISYSRADGRDFAEDLEGRLSEAGLTAWRDLKDVEGGEDIRAQALRAIETAKHVVLILTPRALASDWVKREWTHARAQGVKVSPILADPGLQKRDLPRWMQRSDVYDIEEPERWERLAAVLKGPGGTRRVPYMAGALPPSYVLREAEFNALKAAVLSADAPEEPVVLCGAGGYGKTTLADALSLDKETRDEFSDGIVRIAIGKERRDPEVLSLVADVMEMLDAKGRRPGFKDTRMAEARLAEMIGDEARLLLIVDDVWREAQLRPFLCGGPNCVRLVTTRRRDALPYDAQRIDVDEMQGEEAVALLSWRLPVEDDPAAAAAISALARRLEHWPQMMEISNGWLRGRLRRREPLTRALENFVTRLDDHGLTAFDPSDEAERNRAIGACVAASLVDLSEDDRARFEELAVLPEDEAVPIDVIEEHWARTGEFSTLKTDELLLRLDDASLLQNLDLDARTLQLHDNMVWLLRTRMGEDRLRRAHRAMADALRARAAAGWDALPPEDAYAWRFLVRHLRLAGDAEAANALLLDYDWIRAKLRARGMQELRAAYAPPWKSPAVSLVARAVAPAAPALNRRPWELARQLRGRLAMMGEPQIESLVSKAEGDPQCWPTPRWPDLRPPGAEMLIVFGNNGAVLSATFSPDQTWLLTASSDGTARIWHASTGEEIRVIRGHAGEVTSAAYSPDGGTVVTASEDGTARLWDARSGKAIRVFCGHDGEVTSATFSPDGATVVTASDDDTARLWDAATGEVVRVLRGHEGSVFNAAFSPDGARVVTASSDGTARLWDARNGCAQLVIEGHTDMVFSAICSPDGQQVVTTSYDDTARIWNAFDGTELKVLLHSRSVSYASFSADGQKVVTACDDGKARIWDVTTGVELFTMRGHLTAVTCAEFSPDSALLVTASEDGSTRVWDISAEKEGFKTDHHNDEVRSLAFSRCGRSLCSASEDGEARVLDAATGATIHVLHGHGGTVSSAAFSSDGSTVLTASYDGTARLWDATSGEQLRVVCECDQWITSAAFSSDCTLVVTANGDGTARIFDATTWEEREVLSSNGSLCRSAAFSPDGRHVVTAGNDGCARLWDVESGELVRVFSGHSREEQLWKVAVSANGGFVLTASDDHTVRVWEAATGVEISVLRGHASRVRSAAFISFDGMRVVTASFDRTARIWDAATGEEVACWTMDGSLTAVGTHHHLVALGDGYGGVHVYDVGDLDRRPEP